MSLSLPLTAAESALDGFRLPHRREEDWRWTDLRQLLDRAYPPAHGGNAPAALIDRLDKADVLAGLFYCSCGEKMQRKAPWKRGYSRYYCLGQIAGKSECRAIGEAAIIEHGFSFLGTLEKKYF